MSTHLITHNLPSQNSKPIFKRIRSDLRQIERELINHLSDKCRDRKATRCNRCTRGLNMQRTGYRPLCADRMEQYFPLAILIRSHDCRIPPAHTLRKKIFDLARQLRVHSTVMDPDPLLVLLLELLPFPESCFIILKLALKFF